MVTCRDILKKNISFFDSILNEMVLDTNVLGLSMEGGIGSKGNGTLVVGKDSGRIGDRELYVM